RSSTASPPTRSRRASGCPSTPPTCSSRAPSTSSSSSRSATTTTGAATCAGSSPASARSTAATAACCPARSSCPARTVPPCRTRRCPAWRSSWPTATTRGAGDMPGLDPLALIPGAVIGGGLFLLILSLYGVRPRPSRPRRHLIQALTTRTAVAAIAAVVVLAVTGWPVVAAGTVLLVFAWRGLSGGAAEERAAMRRLEALAAWTESLRDTLAGAAGLEQAIPASIRAAAPSLRPHLRALVDRLHTRMALPDALTRFADDLDDPSADLVVAALVLNSKLRGPGLRDVLGALAVSA